MIIGIDGGGTRTRVEIRDDRNHFLRRAEFGPFNPAAIGEAGFRQRLREVFADVGSMGDVRSLCIGGAGISGGVMETILQEELTASGFRGVLTLCGDHEIALAGAMDGPGCILIAGTGSICCGRDTQGHFARCGGWGHLLDDPGSAYAIGRDALAAAVQTEDGRLPENPLHRAVMTHLAAADAGDIVRYVYHRPATKTEIAALAPLVLDCAQSGDEISLSILRRQAQELKRLAETLISRLSAPRLTLLGGLLETDNPYSRMVRDLLSPIATFVPPLHSPLSGAATLAYRALKNGE